MGRAFDPRDPEQRLDDQSSWKETSNPVLISVTMALDLAADTNLVEWHKVAEVATMIEEYA